MIENYNWLKNIEKLDFTAKKVLIIGGGEIAKQYASSIVEILYFRYYNYCQNR